MCRTAWVGLASSPGPGFFLVAGAKNRLSPRNNNNKKQTKKKTGPGDEARVGYAPMGVQGTESMNLYIGGKM